MLCLSVPPADTQCERRPRSAGLGFVAAVFFGVGRRLDLERVGDVGAPLAQRRSL